MALDVSHKLYLERSEPIGHNQKQLKFVIGVKPMSSFSSPLSYKCLSIIVLLVQAWFFLRHSIVEIRFQKLFLELVSEFEGKLYNRGHLRSNMVPPLHLNALCFNYAH